MRSRVIKMFRCLQEARSKLTNSEDKYAQVKRQMDDEYNQRLQLERQVSKFKDDLDELRKKHEDTSRDRDRKGKQLDIVSINYPGIVFLSSY